MKKHLALFALLFAVLVSCKDDNGTDPVGNENTPKGTDLIPLAVGNYWEYNMTTISQAGDTISTKKILRLSVKDAKINSNWFEYEDYLSDPTILYAADIPTCKIEASTTGMPFLYGVGESNDALFICARYVPYGNYGLDTFILKNCDYNAKYDLNGVMYNAIKYPVNTVNRNYIFTFVRGVGVVAVGLITDYEDYYWVLTKYRLN